MKNEKTSPTVKLIEINLRTGLPQKTFRNEPSAFSP